MKTFFRVLLCLTVVGVCVGETSPSLCLRSPTLTSIIRRIAGSYDFTAYSDSPSTSLPTSIRTSDGQHFLISSLLSRYLSSCCARPTAETGAATSQRREEADDASQRTVPSPAITIANNQEKGAASEGAAAAETVVGLRVTFSVTVSVSVVLTFSLTLNFYFFFRFRYQLFKCLPSFSPSPSPSTPAENVRMVRVGKRKRQRGADPANTDPRQPVRQKRARHV